MLEIAIKLVRTINSAGWAMCIFLQPQQCSPKTNVRICLQTLMSSCYKYLPEDERRGSRSAPDWGRDACNAGDTWDTPALRYPNLTQLLWLIWNITNPWNIQKLNFLDVTGTVKPCHGTVQTRSFCHSRVQVCHFSRVRMRPLPEATGVHDVESSQELLLFSLSLSFVRVSW